MSTFVDIGFLVERQSEVYYLLQKDFVGNAASAYNAEALEKARAHWGNELFKQRLKKTVLPRLQRLEQFLKQHTEAWWDYGIRKRLCVYAATGLLTEI